MHFRMAIGESYARGPSVIFRREIDPANCALRRDARVVTRMREDSVIEAGRMLVNEDESLSWQNKFVLASESPELASSDVPMRAVQP